MLCFTCGDDIVVEMLAGKQNFGTILTFRHLLTELRKRDEKGKIPENGKVIFQGENGDRGLKGEKGDSNSGFSGFSGFSASGPPGLPGSPGLVVSSDPSKSLSSLNPGVPGSLPV